VRNSVSTPRKHYDYSLFYRLCFENYTTSALYQTWEVQKVMAADGELCTDILNRIQQSVAYHYFTQGRYSRYKELLAEVSS
jgi:hypothetical protein